MDLSAVGGNSIPIQIDRSPEISSGWENSGLGETCIKVHWVLTGSRLCGIDLERVEVDDGDVDNVSCHGKEDRAGEENQAYQDGDRSDEKQAEFDLTAKHLFTIHGLPGCKEADGLTGLVSSISTVGVGMTLPGR